MCCQYNDHRRQLHIVNVKTQLPVIILSIDNCILLNIFCSLERLSCECMCIKSFSLGAFRNDKKCESFVLETIKKQFESYLAGQTWSDFEKNSPNDKGTIMYKKHFLLLALVGVKLLTLMPANVDYSASILPRHGVTKPHRAHSTTSRREWRVTGHFGCD